MRTIFETYAELLTTASDADRRVTVAETDERMRQIVSSLHNGGHFPDGTVIEHASMRRVKGLERPAVVWSTGAEIPQSDTTAEWIYTILTRTTGLIVIALAEETPDDVRRVVGTLEPTRLLFWSDGAKRMFEDWRRPQTS